MKYIELTQGFKAIIDDEDFEKVNSFKWWYNQGYAGRFEKGKCILMHRFIMNTPPDMDLGGLFGMFTWGIVHGEGRCDNCGTAFRLYHYLKENTKPVELLSLIGF